MSYDSIIAQLEHFAKDTPAQRPFATIVARWIQAEAAAGRGSIAVADPLVQDIIHDAQMHTACGWIPSLTLAHPAPIIKTGLLTIYCDGSCTNNGRSGAKAGFGVYITRDGVDVKRHSERLGSGEPQTNQRGELRGLQYALNYVHGAGTATAVIYTDSKYSLDCVQKWAANWEKKGWKKADGKDVLHQDVLKPMMSVWKFVSSRVTLHHVLGHTGGSDAASRGNAIADELACLATV